MGKKAYARIEPYETICPECKGSGKAKSWDSNGWTITPECSKCLGVGKFDWIERIMGKGLRTQVWLDSIIEKFAHELADEIDKEILKNITDSCKSRRNII